VKLVLLDTSSLEIAPMQVVDITAICEIEQVIYEVPWTSGNFRDSLSAGYMGTVISDERSSLLGYAMTMKLPDEVHLLNISVAPKFQGKGLGRYYLQWLTQQAVASGAERMLLEVRPSNLTAISLYRSAGFMQVGVRKGYYPKANNQREDALVFSLPLR
jgi:[ribosomal protein S18]-alanine N-acetyltransferase